MAKQKALEPQWRRSDPPSATGRSAVGSVDNPREGLQQQNPKDPCLKGGKASMSKDGVTGRRGTPVAGSSVQTAVSVVLQYAKPSTKCDRSAAKGGSAAI